MLGALYAGRGGWKALAQALADAEDGNAATLLGYADAFVDRESAGTRHQALDAFWAITCLDGPPVGDVAAAARLEARAACAAPRLGAFLVNFSLPCSMWPVPPAARPRGLTAAGAPPILVIGTTDDPATPLVSASRLVRSLDRAALLVAAGEQHTSFLVGNVCVDRAVTRTSSNASCRATARAAETPRTQRRDSSRWSFQICSAGQRRAHFASHPYVVVAPFGARSSTRSSTTKPCFRKSRIQSP